MTATPPRPEPAIALATGRLHTEWQRLYGNATLSSAPHATTRVAVLELGRPADWDLLKAIWQGVQADLGLPAPAIAVNGVDGHQLWFSLAQAVPTEQAATWLDGLVRRYLPTPHAAQVSQPRLGSLPATAPSGHPPVRALAPSLCVPALQSTGHWSAWVTPDLARIFNDEPWLDLPPNPEAQADLLSRIASAPVAHFERACAHLAPATMPMPMPMPTQPAAPTHPAAPVTPNAAHCTAEPATSATSATLAGPWTNPLDFLHAVMNDTATPLPLRMDAAKAMLAHAPHPVPPAPGQ